MLRTRDVKILAQQLFLLPIPNGSGPELCRFPLFNKHLRRPSPEDCGLFTRAQGRSERGQNCRGLVEELMFKWLTGHVFSPRREEGGAFQVVRSTSKTQRSEQDTTHRLVTFSTGSGERRRALKAKWKPWATAVQSEDAGVSSGRWDSTVAAEVKQ